MDNVFSKLNPLPISHRFWWPVLLAVAAAFGLIMHGWVNRPDPLIFNDPDEAMRIVQFRDFIAGQAWRDLIPYRLDPTFDVPMHWSRFVDLSMAALYGPLTFFLPPDQAERAMAIAWPPLMFVLCAVPLVMIAQRFGGLRTALAACVLIGGEGVIWQFLPGRTDHHSAQMAAALFAIAFALRRNRVTGAAATGFATAMALSLGIETLPYLIVLGCFFAADFIRGLRLVSVRVYAMTLGGSATLLFAATVDPRFIFLTACDVLTFNLLAGLLVGSLGLAGACLWAERTQTTGRSRGIVCVVIALSAALISLGLEPRCAKGVIGTFDPMIRPLWFDHIEEIATLFTMVRLRPSYVAGLFVLPVFATVCVLLRLKIFMGRDDGRVLVACFAMAFVVAIFQIRGAFYANVFAAPLVAATLVSVMARSTVLKKIKTAPIIAALGLVMAGVLVSNATGHTATAQVDSATLSDQTVESDVCRKRESYALLASLERGLVLAPIVRGSFILLHTPHAVISAPYHRFDRGIVLGQSILYKMELADAEAAISQRGITYIALCRTDGDSALASVLRTQRPAWATEVSAPGAPVEVFRVDFRPPRKPLS